VRRAGSTERWKKKRGGDLGAIFGLFENGELSRLKPNFGKKLGCSTQFLEKKWVDSAQPKFLEKLDELHQLNSNCCVKF